MPTSSSAIPISEESRSGWLHESSAHSQATQGTCRYYIRGAELFKHSSAHKEDFVAHRLDSMMRLHL